ncbi:MAG: hypothetical protein EA390_10570, partial [Balneolaceae bacterium]
VHRQKCTMRDLGFVKHCFTLRTGNSRPGKLSAVLGFFITGEAKNPLTLIGEDHFFRVSELV